MTDPQAGPVAAAPVCYRHPDRETWIRCQRCERPICPDCMNSAAVGFQCPGCIKEGARTTRSGRLPYGGQHSTNPEATTIGLILVNVAVWISIASNGGGGSGLVDRLALLPRTTLFSDQSGNTTLVEGVSGGAYWQLMTSAFSHVEVWHIAMNMLALYALGPRLEVILGRARFLAVYLLSGLAGSTAVMWLSAEHSQTLGASGALFGVLGGYVVVTLKVQRSFEAAISWVLFPLAFTLFAGSYISWQGHLGGLVGGAVLTALIVYAPRKQRSAFQWSAIAAFTIACVALVLVRVAALS
jgi:membrane associated rhomboid family serine protease